MLRLIILASMMLLVACGASEVSRALPATPGDVAARALVVPTEDEAPAVPMHDAAVVFAVDEARALDLRPRPLAPKSRGFVRRVNGDALAKGIEIVTTSPGAVVQVRPLASHTRSITPLSPQSLVIVDAAGREHPADEAFVAADDGSALRDAGATFGPGVAVGVLAKGLGAGRLGLRAEGVDPSASLLVHVHEPESDLELKVEADADTYLHGDTATIRATTLRDDEAIATDEAHARVRRPDGTVIEVPMRRAAAGEAFEATLRLHDLVPAHGRTWMVEVDAMATDSGGLVVRRSARTAFAVAVPTARISDDATLTLDAGGDVLARVPIEVAAPGRYAASGTLWAIDHGGAARPLALAQAAAFLVPGDDALTLRLPAALAETNVAAAYELRDLRLQDQGRIAVLHRQARAAMLATDSGDR
jgi:hypothetical protein